MHVRTTSSDVVSQQWRRQPRVQRTHRDCIRICRRHSIRLVRASSTNMTFTSYSIRNWHVWHTKCSPFYNCIKLRRSSMFMCVCVCVRFFLVRALQIVYTTLTKRSGRSHVWLRVGIFESNVRSPMFTCVSFFGVAIVAVWGGLCVCVCARVGVCVCVSACCAQRHQIHIATCYNHVLRDSVRVCVFMDVCHVAHIYASAERTVFALYNFSAIAWVQSNWFSEAWTRTFTIRVSAR